MKKHRHPARVAAALAFAATATLTTACDEGTPTGPPVDGVPAVISASVADAGGPIFRSLRLDLAAPAAAEVFYEPVDGGDTFRMRADSVASAHDVLLPRLIADTTYRYVVRTTLDGVESDSLFRGTFTTEPLPADLADIDHTVEGEATFPLVLFNHTVAGGFDGLIAMQTDGRVVWYTSEFGSPTAAMRIPGSHDMVFIARDAGGIVRVSPSGELVAKMPFGDVDGPVHHDITALDATHVALIARDVRTVRDTTVAGESIWVWDTESGATEKVWSAWDFLDWDVDRGQRSEPDDWLHANSLSVGNHGNLILSFHFLNQVISIAPDYQSIEWRLGGVNPTIGVRPEEQFTGQHCAWELPNGHVLVFNNHYELGADGAGPLELEVDGDSARAVWSYEPTPPIPSQIWSGVYRLDDGNSVVSFPVPPPVQPEGGAPPFTVDEVTPSGERIWRLTGPDLTATFRGVPWPSIAGEERVDGMP